MSSESSGDNRIAAILPTTSAQRGILAETAATPGIYVGQQCVELVGPVDLVGLERSWSALCSRHQSLRTSLLRHDKRVFQVVRESSPAVTFESCDVSEFARDDLPAAMVEICKERASNATDAWEGPWVHLTAVRLRADTVWLCITHEHVGIDGRSVEILLDDLARFYESSWEPAPAPADLLDAMRALRHSKHSVPDVSGFDDLLLSTFAPAQRAYASAHVEVAVGSTPLRAFAAEHALTQASVAMAAWFCALAGVRGDQRAVSVVSRDLRLSHPEAGERVVGMLTESCLAIVPIGRDSSLEVVGRDLMNGLLGDSRFPRLHESLRAARRAGASGRPDSLITVYADAGLPDPPRDHRWSLVRARETTEFALDVTVRLGEAIDVDVAFDPARVDRVTVEDLLDVARARLEDPYAGHRHAGLSHSSPGSPARAPESGCSRTDGCVSGDSTARDARVDSGGPASSSAAISQVLDSLLAIAKRVLERSVAAHEDLYGAGIQSLEMVEMVAAFAEGGYQIGMGELLELGSLVEVARLVSSRSGAPAGSATVLGSGSHQPDATSLELGLLSLTDDRSVGRAGTHEQSMLTLATPLEPTRLQAALRTYLSCFPSLDRRWDLAAPGQLFYRGESAIELVVECVSDACKVPAVVRRLAAEDLNDPFTASGRPLMRFALVVGGGTSAILISFHCAMLDGWSFGTFMRDLQQAYLDPLDEGAFVGSDGGPYRTWCHENPADEGCWRSLLGNALPVARPSLLHAHARSATARTVATMPSVRALAARAGVSEFALLHAATHHACLEAFGGRVDQPVAMRMSLRGGSSHAGARAVGSLTADIPVLLCENDLSASAQTVARTVKVAYKAGHLGNQGFRDLMGRGVDELPFDTVIVMENYFERDERFVRGGGPRSWPEISSWRRDVPMAPRAVTLRQEGQRIAVELTSLIDRSPRDAADRLGHAIEDGLAQAHRLIHATPHTS
ncbi:MAG: condensation domain-containing protein [Solirubrobacteraceae bacterium]